LIGQYAYSLDGLGWDEITHTQRIERAQRGGQWMAANGFADGCRHLATNETRWLAQSDEDIWWRYYDTIRVCNPGSTISPASDACRGRYHLAAYDDATACNNAVDYAIADGGIAVVLIHKYDDGSSYMTLAECKTHLDYVATQVTAGTITAVTMADLMTELV